jgi:hypothetical protein
MLVVLMALVSGLLLAMGTARTRNISGHAVFIAGWMLALFSSLVIVQNY